MAEKEYIEREAVNALIKAECSPKVAAYLIDAVATIPAADAIEELRKPKWIPVEERLPDAGKRVLCYCRANIYEVMKMWTDGDWVYDANHVYMHSFVTHWMPLPQPPKEE